MVRRFRSAAETKQKGIAAMSILRKIAPLAATTVMLVGFATGASAYECKAQYETAAFVSPSVATAMHASKSVWSSKVQQKLGLEWSVWNIAAVPVQNCTQTGSNYQCVVMAKPCKYVVQ
jgi:hypothetical protein